MSDSPEGLEIIHISTDAELARCAEVWKDAELLALVNDALAKLKESGRFKEFAEKHGLPLADGE